MYSLVQKQTDKIFPINHIIIIPGIPATLNYIPLDAPYDPSPKLIPYPSWQGNELGNCASGLTTVYRVKADQCNRLWVLDVGTYGYGKIFFIANIFILIFQDEYNKNKYL